MLSKWDKGYTKAELEAAQEKFGLIFPPDLITLFLEKRPVGGHDWRDEAAINRMISWPFESLLFDMEHNGLWWSEWGERPIAAESRIEILRRVVSRAPRLIPLYRHRFLPELPHEAHNPVFSVYGEDTIVYGANLDDYFNREFAASHNQPRLENIKYIPFWSDLVERNQ